MKSLIHLYVLGIFLLSINVECVSNPSGDKELQKLITKGKFIEGYIYTATDSVPTSIMVFPRKQSQYSHIYCVVRHSPDSVSILMPKDIQGYKVSGESFYRHSSQGDCFFIQLRERGEVTLYSRARIPSDNKFMFYLKFPNEKSLQVISPFDKAFSLSASMDSRSEPMLIFKTDETSERFIRYVEKYFNDCPSIINMVSSGFYSIYDLPSIVREYNQRKK